jgi:hypothetical protein
MSASKKPKSPIVDTIPIKGKNYKVTVCYLKHEDLKFYPENPRIYSVLHDGSNTPPSQDKIEQCMQEMEHVRELREQIEEHGGVVEPLYVKEKTLEVVEGNSRLAAYRLLAKKNPVRWDLVKCYLLPKEVNDSAIASLLGQLHLKGKKDWIPYEQASFLYRRHNKDKISVPALAREVGMSKGQVEHRIRVINLMITHQDNKLSRWSYYDELQKGRKLQQARKDHADFEKTAVATIKSGTVTAMEFRDKIKDVVKSQAAIKEFIGAGSLEKAAKKAKSDVADNRVLQKVQQFKSFILDPETKHSIKHSPQTIKMGIAHELTMVKRQLATLLRAAAK